MSIDPQEVKKIAHLARIDIGDHDIPNYVENLSKILNLIEQINQVDTAGITPMAHPLHEVQRLREDEVKETDQHEYFQTIAPEVEAGLYLVPKVIDE